MKQVWCPCCMAMTDYEVEERRDSFSFEMKEYRYNKKTPYCKVCKCALNIPDFVDKNVKARINAVYEGIKKEREDG